jgi:hypothetical protein
MGVFARIFCQCATPVPGPWRLEEDARSPRNGATDSCEPPCGCRELTAGPGPLFQPLRLSGLKVFCKSLMCLAPQPPSSVLSRDPLCCWPVLSLRLSGSLPIIPTQHTPVYKADSFYRREIDCWKSQLLRALIFQRLHSQGRQGIHCSATNALRPQGHLAWAVDEVRSHSQPLRLTSHHLT